MCEAMSAEDAAPSVPTYLRRHYWFAYLYPWTVAFWDHLLMVNLVLLGNYSRLRTITLKYFSSRPAGNVLQIASVYGDLVPRLAAWTGENSGTFDLVDVLPLQLDTARRKISDAKHVRFFNRDASNLGLPTAHYDHVLLYFLLHELPAEVRRETLREAFRVTKHGGEVVIVDFALPYWWNPFRYLWCVFLAIFEPYALGLWWHDIADMVPEDCRKLPRTHARFFGGLFQMTIFTCQ